MCVCVAGWVLFHEGERVGLIVLEYDSGMHTNIHPTAYRKRVVSNRMTQLFFSHTIPTGIFWRWRGVNQMCGLGHTIYFSIFVRLPCHYWRIPPFPVVFTRVIKGCYRQRGRERWEQIQCWGIWLSCHHGCPRPFQQ